MHRYVEPFACRIYKNAFDFTVYGKRYNSALVKFDIGNQELEYLIYVYRISILVLALNIFRIIGQLILDIVVNQFCYGHFFLNDFGNKLYPNAVAILHAVNRTVVVKFKMESERSRLLDYEIGISIGIYLILTISPLIGLVIVVSPTVKSFGRSMPVYFYFVAYRKFDDRFKLFPYVFIRRRFSKFMSLCKRRNILSANSTVQIKIICYFLRSVFVNSI